MNLFKKLTLLSLFFISTQAFAEISSGQQRFSLGGGIFHVNNPSQTAFSLGAEYEYRFDSFLGVGGQVNHIFSSAPMTIVSAPALFLHPLAGDWYVSAAPVFYFGSSIDSKVGARFTTRMPLQLGVLFLIPTFGVDIISGGPNYLVGLSIFI